MRKSISKKLRFKIFERDGFHCRYCGAKPPEVTLEVDHIIPVSKGGTNDEINLTTSCNACNNGKRDNIINLKEHTDKIQYEMQLLKEKEQQVKEYYKYLKKVSQLQQQDSPEIKIICEYFSKNWNLILEESHKRNYKKYISKLSINEIIESIDIAVEKFNPETFDFDNYCYKIMNCKIKEKEGIPVKEVNFLKYIWINDFNGDNLPYGWKDDFAFWIKRHGYQEVKRAMSYSNGRYWRFKDTMDEWDKEYEEA